jgi:hypothetical protein
VRWKGNEFIRTLLFGITRKISGYRSGVFIVLFLAVTLFILVYKP